MANKNKNKVVDTPEVENSTKPLNDEVIYAEEQSEGVEGVVTKTTLKTAKKTDGIVDLDSDVTDITFTEATITKDTVYEVLNNFTANIGVNGTTTAEAGMKVKLSKMSENVIRALIAQGYIKIVG